MNKKNVNAADLLRRYLDGKCTPEAELFMGEWVDNPPDAELDLIEEQFASDLQEMRRRFQRIGKMPSADPSMNNRQTGMDINSKVNNIADIVKNRKISLRNFLEHSNAQNMFKRERLLRQILESENVHRRGKHLNE